MSVTTIDYPTNSLLEENTLTTSTIKNTFNKISEKKTNRDDLSYYYSAGNLNFLFEKGFKPETIEATDITKVPFLPEWYEGIVSIHGSIMPVIDIVNFANNENLNIKRNINTKKYLLKLEHKNHKPIVFKLDSLPQLVNTKQLKTSISKDNLPQWINSYQENESIQLANVNHNVLFDKLITQQ